VLDARVGVVAVAAGGEGEHLRQSLRPHLLALLALGLVEDCQIPNDGKSPAGTWKTCVRKFAENAQCSYFAPWDVKRLRENWGHTSR